MKLVRISLDLYNISLKRYIDIAKDGDKLGKSNNPGNAGKCSSKAGKEIEMKFYEPNDHYTLVAELEGELETAKQVILALADAGVTTPVRCFDPRFYFSCAKGLAECPIIFNARLGKGEGQFEINIPNSGRGARTDNWIEQWGHCSPGNLIESLPFSRDRYTGENI